MHWSKQGDDGCRVPGPWRTVITKITKIKGESAGEDGPATSSSEMRQLGKDIVQLMKAGSQGMVLPVAYSRVIQHTYDVHY